MTELLTQAEVEDRMYYGGVKRADDMMARAEEKGRASTNPYAQEIFDEFVMPIARALNTELDSKRPGVRAAHAALLGSLDVEATAALAVRTCLNEIMMYPKNPDLRSVASAIGRTVHCELVLDQIADFNPDLYHTLTVDFNRRLSKDERHRMTVYKMQAAKAGINLVEWPIGARDQVGIYLMGLMEAAGMIEIDRPRLERGKQAKREVHLSEALIERIQQIKGFVSVTMPVYGPCVERPLPWTTFYDGGFHTARLRRAHSCLIHHRQAKRLPHVAQAAAPTFLAAANALQDTRWQVNEEVLDAVLEVGKWFSVGDIASPNSNPRPAAPEWLQDHDPETRAGWSQYRQDEFRNWKRAMTDWYTARKLAGSAFARYYAATRSAEMFRGYPTLHFVYFADSRGRLYPMTYGLNPQGGDLQRGLLRFAEGKPLIDEKSVMWFCIQGANKYGFDKATFEERQAWVMEREELILSFAENPVDNRGWKDAGDPIQFLAWCFEFKRWRESPHSFVSHLPISMDGSCNGLQNLSALLRDQIGGEATNLTANSQMQDIYRRVAEAATRRLQTTSEDEAISQSLRSRWLQHGISRSVVKRSVMTTPYGVTKRSAADYVVSDYLRDPTVQHPFEKPEFMKAGSYLMEHVWPAIGDVVVKGRECMDWLRKGARLIIADEKAKGSEYPVICWTSPSGFPAFQSYYEHEEHRINTRLQGPMKIVTVTETDEPDQNRHSTGLAPNFVHSMDAAHLHLTAAAAAAVSIDAMAMIHDDYGCHACDAERFFHIIRQQFVSMYEANDPIEEFHARYPVMPAPPVKGTLDIREVLESRYFFS